MTVSDIYKLLDKFSYCSYKDTFSLQTNRFPLFDLSLNLLFMMDAIILFLSAHIRVNHFF